MKMINSACIDITYDCNFRCLHCFNSSGEQGIKREYMTDEEILKTAENIMDMEPESICLCGGETMLRKDIIFKVLDLKNEKKLNNISINCVSNGFLINEDIVKVLKEKNMGFVQISLDGATKEKHEWLRNMHGSYDKAINAIKLLVKYNIPVGVAFTPTKRNIDEIGQAIDLAKNLGVFIFRIQPIMSLGRAKKYLTDYLPDLKDYMKIKYVVEQKQRQYKDKNFIEWGDPIDHLHIGNYLDTVICIGAYGDIIPSEYLPISVGNIKKHNLNEYIENGVLDVWKNNNFLKNVAEKIKEFDHMDTKEIGLPSIFTQEYIFLDILDDNYKEKTLDCIKKYCLEEKNDGTK